MEEKEGGRENILKNRNCQQMGTAPAKVLHWQAEGLTRKKSKGRCEDLPAD